MIIIVSELYYPEDTSTGYIVTHIAEGLAKTYPVRVLTCPSDYSGRKSVPNVETINGVFVERICAPSLNKNNIIKRIIRSLLLSVLLAWKLLRVVKKTDVVMVVTNPAPILVVMSIVCKFVGVPFIILAHDVFPDNLEASRLLNKNSFLYKCINKVFCAVYERADHIIVIGRDMKELICGKLKKDKQKIAFIPNWADTNDIIPSERVSNDLLLKHNLINYFVVEFAGNVGRVQGVEYLIAAAEILKNDGIHFLFVGAGAKYNLVADAVKARNLENITMVGAFPRNQQQLFLNACDVGLVSLAPGMFGLGVPSKAYNILAAGKPIVAVVDSASEIGRLVKEENVGWVVPPGDPAALATALREAKSHPDLAEMGRKARHVAMEKYSLTTVIQRYVELFSNYVKYDTPS